MFKKYDRFNVFEDVIETKARNLKFYQIFTRVHVVKHMNEIHIIHPSMKIPRRVYG